MTHHHRTAAQIADGVRAGDFSAEEVACAHLTRARAVDGDLGALLHLDEEGALAAARAVDTRVAAGEDPGPLAGVPLIVKDNLAVRGAPLTCASRILEGYVPVFDATVVERLRAAGAVVLGKSNLDEFAMGSSNETSARGPCRNPWDTSRVPGGSSGGSAVAVAARMAPLALGSDTGGSIRLPAAFCGVLGLKPTYGAVSRYGLVAFASSLDQVGPFTRSAADAARCLRALVGADPRDATSAAYPDPARLDAVAGRDLAGLRVGVVEEMRGEGLEPGVATRFEEALGVLEACGAELVEVSLPTMRFAVPTYYVVASAEASSNLARYDGVRYGAREPGDGDLASMYRGTRGARFGPEVKRRILLGTFVLSAGYQDAWYQKAQRARTRLRAELDAALARVDVLAGPTCPTTAFPLGARADDPVAMYLTDVCTVLANLSGLPAVSIPCGRDPAGLPVGLQLMGRAFDEATLLAAAHGIEQRTGYHSEDPLA